MNPDLAISSDQLDDICQRWKIQRLALFGSILHGTEHANSDVDLLVDFAPDADWSLLDFIALQQELTTLLGRPVDLVERAAIESGKVNTRRDTILNTAQDIYVA